MALCLALYARDSSGRHIPVGAMNEEEYSESFKVEIFEKIKNELSKNAPDDWSMLKEYDFQLQDTQLPISNGYKRQHDSILKEFGWTLIPFITLVFN
jgi:hypothetical protein